MPLSGRDRTPRKGQAGKRILPVAEIQTSLEKVALWLTG